MGTLERTETLTHRIGGNGRVSVKTLTGTLRIRGIEGEDAHLSVTYRIRAADQLAAERALDTGRVIVDRGPGSLEVETPDRRVSTGLAWLFGGARVFRADVSLDVPWGTKIRYETMSGSIEAMALVGDQRYKTVSGEVRLWSVGGMVEAGSVTGSITLDKGGDIRLRANTVSGGIKVRARRFHGLTLSTTSGGIAIIGELDPTGDYRAESISGRVDLTPLSGVTAELRAVSGSIVSHVAHRSEGSRGYWRSIVGDGRSSFKVNSTSGSLYIYAARPEDRVVAEASPAAPSAPPAPSAPAAPAAPAWSAGGAASAPPVEDPAPAETEETWSPDEDGVAGGESGGESVAEVDPEDDLAVLQALERGEIGVDEAADRLARPKGLDHVG
jgi:hypothetical protein